MIKIVEVNGKKYEIDTTPREPSRSTIYAVISGITESPARGVVANFLRDIGREPVTLTRHYLNDAEEQEVVLSLGWKFSRSNQWRELFNYYSLKDKKGGTNAKSKFARLGNNPTKLRTQRHDSTNLISQEQPSLENS